MRKIALLLVLCLSVLQIKVIAQPKIVGGSDLI